MSPFWVILFYFTMILLGLSQQMALVHTIASGLIAIRPDHFLQFESSLTFMSCLLGLVFSFPMATEVRNCRPSSSSYKGGNNTTLIKGPGYFLWGSGNE